MPRSSTIKRLPAEVRETIGRLRDAGHTIDEILDHLRRLDIDVSRSALGRHTKQLDAVGDRLRRSRQVAEAIVDRFGSAPEHRVGRLNIELMHDVVLQLMVGEDGDGVTLDPKDAMMLARSLKDLASAAKIDAEQILAARKEAAKQAAEAVGGAQKELGLSAETIGAIKAKILGVGEARR